MNKRYEWDFCENPKKGDIVKWTEPLWAKPNKPRGKRDKIGEQNITAKVITTGKIVELQVISVEKISGDAELTVKEGDNIKRKETSLEKGDCHKRLG